MGNLNWISPEGVGSGVLTDNLNWDNGSVPVDGDTLSFNNPSGNPLQVSFNTNLIGIHIIVVGKVKLFATSANYCTFSSITLGDNSNLEVINSPQAPTFSESLNITTNTVAPDAVTSGSKVILSGYHTSGELNLNKTTVSGFLSGFSFSKINSNHSVLEYLDSGGTSQDIKFIGSDNFIKTPSAGIVTLTGNLTGEPDSGFSYNPSLSPLGNLKIENLNNTKDINFHILLNSNSKLYLNGNFTILKYIHMLGGDLDLAQNSNIISNKEPTKLINSFVDSDGNNYEYAYLQTPNSGISYSSGAFTGASYFHGSFFIQNFSNTTLALTDIFDLSDPNLDILCVFSSSSMLSISQPIVSNNFKILSQGSPILIEGSFSDSSFFDLKNESIYDIEDLGYYWPKIYLNSNSYLKASKLNYSFIKIKGDSTIELQNNLTVRSLMLDDSNIGTYTGPITITKKGNYTLQTYGLEVVDPSILNTPIPQSFIRLFLLHDFIDSLNSPSISFKIEEGILELKPYLYGSYFQFNPGRISFWSFNEIIVNSTATLKISSYVKFNTGMPGTSIQNQTINAYHSYLKSLNLVVAGTVQFDLY